MFGISGAGMSSIKNYANGGKRARRSLDQWDRQSEQSSEPGVVLGQGQFKATAVLTRVFLVMNRDRRLTGFLRGQSDNPIAPAGYELNNPWSVWLHQRRS